MLSTFNNESIKVEFLLKLFCFGLSSPSFSKIQWLLLMIHIGHLPEAIRRESRTRLSTSLRLLARLLARLLLLASGLFEAEEEAKGLSARLTPALDITR